MKQTITNLSGFLKSLPSRLRFSLFLVFEVVVVVLLLSSCGPTVRVSAKSTTDSVSISISQSVADSTGLSVSVNPHININH